MIAQSRLFEEFKKKIEENSLAHGYLFHSKSDGYGAIHLALNVIKEIFSSDSKGNFSVETHSKLLQHPDLHLFFPISTNEKVKKDPKSKNFFHEIRDYLNQTNFFPNLSDWYEYLGIEKKQAQIGIHDVVEIQKIVHAKPFTGEKKVILIWRAELINNQSANKLLKVLEEPPKGTYFFLISNDLDRIISTILSRVQTILVEPLKEDFLENYLENKNIESENIVSIINQSEGDLVKVEKLLSEDSSEFEELFITLIRSVFMVKTKTIELTKILDLTNDKISKFSRDKIKQFLEYCLEVLRVAFLQNFSDQKDNYFRIREGSFNYEKFSEFIHSGNIQKIQEDFSKAHYYITRNGNEKLVIFNLMVSLTRSIHAKR